MGGVAWLHKPLGSGFNIEEPRAFAVFCGKRSMQVTFSSKVQRDFREEVENLLFLNPCQKNVRVGIAATIEQFGRPWLEERDDNIVLHVGDRDVQFLFAFDSSRAGNAPVGVVVFVRTTISEMVILHLAVHPKFGLRGRRAGPGLGVALIEKVGEIASRIKGVERVLVCYHAPLSIRVRRSICLSVSAN